MKKVYYYFILHNIADVEHSVNEETRSLNSVVRGGEVICQSFYFTTIENALKNRNVAIENSRGYGENDKEGYYYKCSPVMEGWVNDNEKCYDEK